MESTSSPEHPAFAEDNQRRRTSKMHRSSSDVVVVKAAGNSPVRSVIIFEALSGDGGLQHALVVVNLWRSLTVLHEDGAGR